MRLLFLTGFILINISPTQFCASQKLNNDSSTTSFTLTSKILGEQNKALIYLPGNYYKSSEKYPVVYVLDGEYNFSFTWEAVKILYQSERIPPCIVVAIISNNRGRDFTPWQNKKAD